MIQVTVFMGKLRFSLFYLMDALVGRICSHDVLKGMRCRKDYR